MRFFVFLSLCLSLWAKQPLPPLEAKLYAFIQNNQIIEHPLERYVGTWPSYPKYTGVRKEIPESNSFMTLQTLIILDEISQEYTLPGLKKVISRANKQILNYVKDAKKTDEPKGTIAFWPLIQDDNGRWIRSFDIQWYNSSMRILNVGNDFDTSSQAFVWLYLQNQDRRFLDDFVNTVGLFTDTNRSLEHPLNLQWKEPDSGAFLTWAEDEAPIKEINRIMDLVNDVDCVVNLNILTSLSLYENNIASLPFHTRKAKEASCRLTHEVILMNKEERCATWYTRPSHFYLAYSKAYKADTYCLEQDKELILNRAKKRSRYLLAHPGLSYFTEMAEYIIILKSLVKNNKRGYFLRKLIVSLENELKKGITVRENYAYLPSKHSLFGGEAFGLFRFNWYGRANATALALKALTMK
ncbi:hypothetical protein ACFLR3_00650 [Campylobacterota bacterium]